MVLGGTAFAQDIPNPNPVASAKRKPSISDAQRDPGWISLNGTVVSAKDDSFILDYGKANIMVDLSKWNLQKGDLPLSDGDKVSVSGYIENVGRRSLQARTVYVRDLNTHYYVDPSREIEPLLYPQPDNSVDALADEPRVVVTGTVTGVSGREFTL